MYVESWNPETLPIILNFPFRICEKELVEIVTNNINNEIFAIQ